MIFDLDRLFFTLSKSLFSPSMIRGRPQTVAAKSSLLRKEESRGQHLVAVRRGRRLLFGLKENLIFMNSRFYEVIKDQLRSFEVVGNF